MGDIAGMTVNGEMCSWCGTYFTRPHGYPVICKSCAFDHGVDDVPSEDLVEVEGVQHAIYPEHT